MASSNIDKNSTAVLGAEDERRPEPDGPVAAAKSVHPVRAHKREKLVAACARVGVEGDEGSGAADVVDVLLIDLAELAKPRHDEVAGLISIVEEIVLFDGLGHDLALQDAKGITHPRTIN
eukprot:CAMPEP_0174886316 /NCGR_PEP_ID=MMETSP0167-20121228/1563_1 /TAXON_ID=38298 /ORGANISM="Rhodella maculata, Strain CCMP736" /LENGTH=119 /DNA_ID=CAMNT_0016122265 /DNA_START=368 /DNA_END=726 /DNA_ORIENTATION=-